MPKTILDPRSRSKPPKIALQAERPIDQTNDRFGYSFYLEHSSGARLYPVRMRNRDTGKLTFRISSRGNTKAEGREIEDESELYRLVASGTYSVRVAALNGGPANLLKPGRQCIKRLVKNSW